MRIGKKDDFWVAQRAEKNIIVFSFAPFVPAKAFSGGTAHFFCAFCGYVFAYLEFTANPPYNTGT